jgi:Periplasmic binding protein
VVAVGEDGPEWLTAKNMFSVFGALNTTKVATTFGQFMNSQGVTNLGELGYGVSPVSAESAKGDAASAETAGITVGYLNANFPFGSTNVAPVAIAMNAGGVNGFTASTDPNTAFLLITALKQQGVTLQASLLATSRPQVSPPRRRPTRNTRPRALRQLEGRYQQPYRLCLRTEQLLLGGESWKDRADDATVTSCILLIVAGCGQRQGGLATKVTLVNFS